MSQIDSRSHPLFVNPEEQDAPIAHDLRWALSMDIAMATAVLALKNGLHKSLVSHLHSEYCSMIPDEHSRCAVAKNKLPELVNWQIPPDTPWSAKQVCHFILASAHRKYAIHYQSEKWMKSHFGCVPVGVPRTTNTSLTARNYTKFTNSKYKSYQSRTTRGVTYQMLPDLTHRKSGQQQIPLTETTDSLWLHTRVCHLETIWEAVDALALDFFRASSRENAFQEHIPKIHWWLSQAMPYRRGSAAIADMFVRSLCRAKGISIGFWRPGIMPDLEALCRPLSSYCNDYQSFFEDPT